jgi:hypothetical protein
MQNNNYQALSLDRTELAGILKPMKDLEAWNKFEDGLKDVTSMEEALAWVKQNQAIVEKLTIRAMIRKFNDDISKANKSWRN